MFGDTSYGIRRNRLANLESLAYIWLWWECTDWVRMEETPFRDISDGKRSAQKNHRYLVQSVVIDTNSISIPFPPLSFFETWLWADEAQKWKENALEMNIYTSGQYGMKEGERCLTDLTKPSWYTLVSRAHPSLLGCSCLLRYGSKARKNGAESIWTLDREANANCVRLEIRSSEKMRWNGEGFERDRIAIEINELEFRGTFGSRERKKSWIEYMFDDLFSKDADPYTNT